MAVDVEHGGERQRCGVNVTTGGAVPKSDETKSGNKGEGKKSKPAAKKAPTAPSAAGKDEEMKDANAETGEQTTNADVPMEVSVFKTRKVLASQKWVLDL